MELIDQLCRFSSLFGVSIGKSCFISWILLSSEFVFTVNFALQFLFNTFLFVFIMERKKFYSVYVSVCVFFAGEFWMKLVTEIKNNRLFFVFFVEFFFVSLLS